MYRFDSDTEVTPLDDGRWEADVDAGWCSIGGTPNGGYTLAVALSAASRTVPNLRPLSVSAVYVKPVVAGKTELAVEIVKQGRMKSSLQVTMRQEGSERLRLLATYGNDAMLGWPIEFAPPPAAIPSPEECVAPPVAAGAEATIADRFEYRVTPQTRWVTGTRSGTPQLDGWIRFSDGREPDLTSLPLFADAFPPSIYEVVDTALAPTTDLSVHLRQPPSPGWLQARFTTRALIGGVIEEDGEFWDAEGKLVGMSRQLALVVPLG